MQCISTETSPIESDPACFLQAKLMYMMGLDAYMDTQPQMLLLVPVEPLIALAAQLHFQCGLLEIQAHG